MLHFVPCRVSLLLLPWSYRCAAEIKEEKGGATPTLVHVLFFFFLLTSSLLSFLLKKFFFSDYDVAFLSFLFRCRRVPSLGREELLAMPTITPAQATNSSALYSEELFYSVLKQGNPTRERVNALASLALRHLSKAPETWAAIRVALMEQSNLDGPLNRTLWYVTDALMKHAPHTYVPLIAPRLMEYTAQQLPWSLVAQGHASRQWFEVLVLSWDSILPPRLFATLRQHAVQSRSGAELHGLLESSPSRGDAGELATAEELQRLRDSWDAMKYWSGAGVGGTTASTSLSYEAGNTRALAAAEDLLADYSVSAALSPPSSSAALAPRQTTHGEVDTDESAEDDDYVPNFVAGAQPRELPKLDIPKRRRREGRRRPRDDDLDF